LNPPTADRHQRRNRGRGADRDQRRANHAPAIAGNAIGDQQSNADAERRACGDDEAEEPNRDEYVHCALLFRVRAALRAAAFRARLGRRRAAPRACLDNAVRDALWPARFNAFRTARARRGDGRCARPARAADLALFLVDALALRPGGASFTPARRAFDRPIAMACFVERAPCLPSRT
jgi:hypothetical protein